MKKIGISQSQVSLHKRLHTLSASKPEWKKVTGDTGSAFGMSLQYYKEHIFRLGQKFTPTKMFTQILLNTSGNNGW